MVHTGAVAHALVRLRDRDAKVPVPMSAFTSLPLSAPLLRALDVLGFATMTPVQEHALPALLTGRDLIGQARTGSGKTVAFGLALLSRVDVKIARVQALVLCPTRELADQVSEELRRLARFIPNLKVVTLCGGVPVRTQTSSLERAPHVVVGTPGRILDHLRRQTLELQGLRVVVLDEADRMLDMGFADAIAELSAQLPRDRQTLLFSATFPDEIRRMSRAFQRAPVEITVDTAPAPVAIRQVFFEVEAAHKQRALEALLHQHAPETALVFCHTRNDVREVTAGLLAQGFSTLALHGELEQRERDEVLIRFANKSCAVLVATDVAARGLDVKGLSAVISYELPIDPDVHTHRVGRTGRAGERGLALGLCAPKERSRAAAIEARLGTPLTWGRVQLDAALEAPAPASMVTLEVAGGKADKLRAGDLLGALTGEVGLAGDAVGKIDILRQRSFVAVRRADAARALAGLRAHKIKGRAFKVRPLEESGAP